MHMPIQFDTLDYAKRLASSGVPTVQAEAHAAALGDALGSSVVVHGELATVERNVLGEIKLVEQKLKSLEQKIDSRFDAGEQKADSRFNTWEQKIHARLERMDLRHGADMKHVYWMMSTLILLNLGILSKVMLQY